jgi:hypothetical protein
MRSNAACRLGSAGGFHLPCNAAHGGDLAANAGHSEWEVGLVLNHAGSGSVTAGYSHGYPLELKRQLLSKWADHVERLVQPQGAALLR